MDGHELGRENCHMHLPAPALLLPSLSFTPHWVFLRGISVIQIQPWHLQASVQTSSTP